MKETFFNIKNQNSDCKLHEVLRASMQFAIRILIFYIKKPLKLPYLFNENYFHQIVLYMIMLL